MTEQNAETAAQTAGDTGVETYKVLTPDGVEIYPLETVGALDATALTINKPQATEQIEIILEPNQKYVFDFSDTDMQSFTQDGNILTITFADDAVITLQNFEGATTHSTRAFLVFQNDGGASVVEVIETVPNQDELDDPQSEIREGSDDEVAEGEMGETGDEVAAIEPASGELTAQQVANIEPAAGNEAGDGTNNTGFTYDEPSITPVGALNAVGPLGPTRLQYGVEYRNDEVRGTDENPEVPSEDGRPVLVGPAAQTLDESFLGPLSVSDSVNVDFGPDGPGPKGVFPTGTYSVSGSSEGGATLLSGGKPVDIQPTADGYIGTINGGADAVFTLVINPTTGDYTFTQILPIDHADQNNPDDVINLTFEIRAEDADGDADIANIVINISDDAPSIATPSTNTLNESALSSGPVVINDTLTVDFGNDIEGQVIPDGGAPTITGTPTLTSNGQPITITPTTNGYIGTLPGGAPAFTLTINPTNGDYTFTQNVPLDHVPGGSDTIALEFPVDVVDYDGDKKDTSITINIQDSGPKISKPTLGSGTEVLDETDLPGVSATGKLVVNFGEDSPGSITPTNIFTSTGSKLGGNLTSGTEEVKVELVGDTYIGYTGADVTTGSPVFTLKVSPDGTYDFELLGTLDHADPNDPNDIINLEFGVVATDGDGDMDNATIVIKVKDDVPSIGDAKADVDETNFDQGDLDFTDTIDVAFGADFGSVQPTGTASTTDSSGNPITLLAPLGPYNRVINITPTADGYEGIIAGTTVKVFELTLDAATGEYTYTQFGKIIHPDNTDGNDIVTINFDIEVVSTDGTTDTGTITINVADDGVVANDDVTAAEEGQLITGNVLNNDDLSQDTANLVNKVIFEGTEYNLGTPYGGPGGMTINGNYGTLRIGYNGSYTYEANDSGANGTDTFTYILRDRDGDNDTATLSISVTPDGAPVATTAKDTVDETNLSSGPLTVSDTLTVDFGEDGPGTITPNGTVTPSGYLAGGTLSSDGQPVEIKPTANGYEAVIQGTTTPVFEFTIDDTGNYEFELFEPLDHSNTTDPNEAIKLDFGVDITDADGDTVATTVTINVLDDAPIALDDTNTVPENQTTATGNVVNNDTASEDAPSNVTSIKFGTTTVNVTPGVPATINGDHGTLEIAADGSYTYTSNGTNASNVKDVFTYTFTDGDGDSDTAELTINVADINDKPKLTGSTVTVDETDIDGEAPLGEDADSNVVTGDFGADGPGTFTLDGLKDFNGALNNALTSNGAPVDVKPDGKDLVGVLANGDEIFRLTLNETTGQFTFTLTGTLDHADVTDPNDIIELNFNVIGTDIDGDTSNTTITVNVKDDAPIIGESQGDVDESNLDQGDLTYSDTLATNFGAELSTMSPNGTVNAEVNGNPITLTAGGETVTLTPTANGYEGTTPGAGTIFMLVIDSATGKYTYTQVAPFDHPDGTDPNDTIELNFGVEVTNNDGDTDSGTITISVADDGPIANDDVTGAEEGQTITGNVTDNDEFSQDTDNTVTRIEVNGIWFDVPPNAATQTFVTTDALGTLRFKSDGSYEFTASNNNPDGTFTINYELTDSDGDTDIATLSIRVSPDGEPIVTTAKNTVDETDLSSGSLTVSDTLLVDFGQDGAGTIGPNGIASPSGSLAGGALTSGGQPIEIKPTANGYEGVFQGTATQVFVFTIDNTGKYDFELFAPLDHADSTNPNDLIALDFGVNVTDSDGDITTSTVTINVLDDAPVALDDTNTVPENQTTATGNVVNNDTASEDTPSNVTSIKFGTTTVNVTPGVPATINGDHGTLEISANGTYTYTSNGTNTLNVQDVFTYTLTDSDGDADTAELTIDIADVDNKPIVTGSTVTVDDTDLAAAGLDTDSGTITANFGNDGPGTFAFDSVNPIIGPQLSSNGQTINIEVKAGLVTGTINGGADTVFELILNQQTGQYTIELTGSIDHPDGTNPDDLLAIQIPVNAIDADSDVGGGYVTVNFLDDGPIANDDVTIYDTTTGKATGNVITGLNGGPGAADVLSQDNGTTEGSDHDVIEVSFKGNVVTIPAGGSNTIEGDYGFLKIFDNGDYTYALKGGIVLPTTTVTHTLDPQPSDVAGTQTTITKDGITVTTVNGGDLTFTDDGIGIFDGAGSDRVYGNDEKLNVTFDNADEITLTMGDLGNNPDSAMDFTIYLSDGSTHTIEVPNTSIAQTNDVGSVTFVGSDYGAGLTITGVDVFSHSSPTYGRTSFSLVDVETKQITTDIICEDFEYVLQDGDGDSDSATLSIKVEAPENVFIVGDNVDDVQGETTPWIVGNGNAAIEGYAEQDVLVGDAGGSATVNRDQDYNFVYILDVSGSMGDNDPNDGKETRVELMIDTVKNLMNDFNQYQNGHIKTHIVAFAQNVKSSITIDFADPNALANAISYLDSLTGNGYTNYEAPMQSAISWLSGSEPLGGDAITQTIFVSDGEPNRHLNDQGNVVNPPGTTAEEEVIILAELIGTTVTINGKTYGDNTDEIGGLLSYGEVVSVGVNVADNTILNAIDSTGQATYIDDASQLHAVLSGANPLNHPGDVGGDVITGGGGVDLIYGDALYTDNLADDQGLSTAEGAGWEVFARLENGEGLNAAWNRADTLEYIRSNAESMSQESVGTLGDTRGGGDDIIDGGASTDVIFGQEGNDRITGGEGNDYLYGGTGNDVFVYNSTDEGVDTIKDFTAGEDVLDVSALLQGYDALQDSIDDFVFATESAGNTTISVDVDGTGGPNVAVDIAVLEAVTGLSIEEITNNGETTI